MKDLAFLPAGVPAATSARSRSPTLMWTRPYCRQRLARWVGEADPVAPCAGAKQRLRGWGGRLRPWLPLHFIAMARTQAIYLLHNLGALGALASSRGASDHDAQGLARSHNNLCGREQAGNGGRAAAGRSDMAGAAALLGAIPQSAVGCWLRIGAPQRLEACRLTTARVALLLRPACSVRALGAAKPTAAAPAGATGLAHSWPCRVNRAPQHRKLQPKVLPPPRSPCRLAIAMLALGLAACGLAAPAGAATLRVLVALHCILGSPVLLEREAGGSRKRGDKGRQAMKGTGGGSTLCGKQGGRRHSRALGEVVNPLAGVHRIQTGYVYQAECMQWI